MISGWFLKFQSRLNRCLVYGINSRSLRLICIPFKKDVSHAFPHKFSLDITEKPSPTALETALTPIGLPVFYTSLENTDTSRNNSSFWVHVEKLLKYTNNCLVPKWFLWLNTKTGKLRNIPVLSSQNFLTLCFKGGILPIALFPQR